MGNHRATGAAEGHGWSFTVSWKNDGLVLGAASLVALLGRPVRERFVEPHCFPCDEEAVNPLDRDVVRWHSRSLDALSYVLEIAALITPVVSSLREQGPSRNLLKDLLVCTEVIAINSAANIVVKTVVARPVPRVYTTLLPRVAARGPRLRLLLLGSLCPHDGGAGGERGDGPSARSKGDLAMDARGRRGHAHLGRPGGRREALLHRRGGRVAGRRGYRRSRPRAAPGTRRQLGKT